MDVDLLCWLGQRFAAESNRYESTVGYEDGCDSEIVLLKIV